MFKCDDEGKRIRLFCPISIPNASGYLWNDKMMLQMSCRGYATAQHMQPIASKYSYGQSLEATTFMQPEHHYHPSHPGRFFYIRVNGGSVFSLPYEPMRVPMPRWEFSQGLEDLSWHIEYENLQFDLCLQLGENDAVERWSLKVTNHQQSKALVQIFPCFSIGYASWMNQSADFEHGLNGILGRYITPYQKVADYYKNQSRFDNTVLLADSTVLSYEANLNEFIGEGGMHHPSALDNQSLSNSQALYQVPVAVLQHELVIDAEQNSSLNWIFAPVKNIEQAHKLKTKYLDQIKYTQTDFVKEPQYTVNTQDKNFDGFINTWLPRQIQYHCDANRLTLDPQTRNYLQDHMASVLINPKIAKQRFLFALAQQKSNGAMPDGILLSPDAELNYINQIPHSDHNVWLFVFIDTYLNHGNDLSILSENVRFSDSKHKFSVLMHLELAANYLYQQLDARGLSLIEQGDWCDPMNMVGKDGVGVSIWLSLASAYVFGLFAEIYSKLGDEDAAKTWILRKNALNQSVNQLAWDGDWYARGICDNGRLFGISQDKEGAIYLNPQTWAMLSDAASQEQLDRLLLAIEQYLDTPYGTAMLAPAYTAMDEDIGRITQKFPGTAENGSVYNHAACFYAFALVQKGYADKGFAVLRNMLVDESNIANKQQLPNFVPNYYRGAYHQFPTVAGRSSHLFNTGTCAWYLRCVVELIFGITSTQDTLTIKPCMPSSLGNSSITFKRFDSQITINCRCVNNIESLSITAPNLSVVDQTVRGFKTNRSYILEVLMPEVNNGPKKQAAAIDSTDEST